MPPSIRVGVEGSPRTPAALPPVPTLCSRCIFYLHPVADPGFPNGWGKDEAPKAPRAVWYGEGVSPSPLGRGLGRGLCPLPEFFLIFHLKNSEFQCIMGSILSQFSCPFYNKKTVFWLPELANESTACNERDLVCLHKITSGLVGCKKRL